MSKSQLRAVLAVCAVAAVIIFAMAVFHISPGWLVVVAMFAFFIFF